MESKKESLECLHFQKHALIIGSSGIVGHNLTKYLLLNHDWRVSGVCKKSYEFAPKGIDLLTCDLLNLESSKQTLSSDRLKSVTHAFFVSWIPSDNDQKELELNSKLLENTLNIVGENCPNLRYFYLQTGTKYYGAFENKRSIIPFRENLSRLDTPMYYYSQEDLLKNFAKEKKNFGYGIARPPAILGFTLDNAMNFGVSLATYAAIMKESGEPLIFPGTEKAFYSLREFIDVGLLCRFILWQQSHEHAHGQAFNISNGDVIRPAEFWPLVAKYFGMEYKIADSSFKISDHMKGKEGVWKKIVEKYNLHNLDIDRVETFKFLDCYLAREWDEISSINKVEKYGFRCHNDSDKILLNFFDSLKNLRIIPSIEPSTA